MRVQDIMKSNVITVSPDASTVQAFQKMKKHHIHHLLVRDEQHHLLGVLSTSDFPLALEILSQSEPTTQEIIRVSDQPVAQTMTANPITVTPETTVEEAARLMINHEFHCLPVIRDQKIVGIITDRDLLKIIAQFPETSYSAPSEKQQHVEHTNFDTETFLRMEWQRIRVILLDICLHGVLLKVPDVNTLNKGQMYLVDIHLDNAPALLTFEAIFAHVDGNNAGFEIRSVTLENFIHLRRLLEMKTGNPDAVYRKVIY